MDDYIKFNNQTSGRDKMFRLLQYCSRILWYSLEKRHCSPNGIQKAKKLDETLGLMRRLLRFGRCFDTLHSALPVLSSVNDQVVRLTSALSRISSACFMFLDHIVCLEKLSLLPAKSINASAWDKTSTRFWLYSIIMGLIRDVYEILRIYREEYRPRRRQLKHHHRTNNQSSQYSGYSEKNYLPPIISSNQTIIIHCVTSAKTISKCITKHADITIDSLKNVCDIFIPLNVLGYVNISPGMIGFLGIISTIASALPQINPMVKMVPAT